MGLRINQNVEAMNAYRHLSETNNTMSKSLEKLSSGFRINRAADDAAGLSISEKLRSQIGGFKVAMQNAQDGISMLQTAEGALNETTSLLQRMRDLAVQAANGTQDSASRSAADAEVQADLSEVTRISSATSYGNISLLSSGTAATYSFTFQVGNANTSTDQITVSISNMSAGSASVTGLGLSGLSIASAASAQAAISSIDAAIATVSAQRSQFGAVQNRLEHTVANLGVAVENLSASESRIRDTDMASEMVSFTKSQILSQAGTAMLAQANQAPQNVLSLLRG